jgi:RecQ-mediated genome instability protein 1
MPCGVPHCNIEFLNPKVLIVGPVECRRGVLLLQEHNLEILGGEIDSLLISNATENVLARLL